MEFSLPALLLCAASAAAQTSTSELIYFPKPTQPSPYIAPMKPIVRLAELKSRHKGQPNWSETVVADFYNDTQVISAAPGTKVALHLHADSPEYWFVEEGRIRFEIDDPPGTPQKFEAGKGSLVFAPERMLHSLDIIGDQPSIRVQVTLREATPIYPVKPDNAPPGAQLIRATVWVNPNPSDVPNAQNQRDRLLFNLPEMLKSNAKRSWSDLAIEKNRAHANIICGYAADLKPKPGDRGHFHDFPETWIVMQGEQRFVIEGEAPFVAAAGDIVYAPSTRWHLPQPYGDAQSCRLAMTPFPNGNHLYDPPQQ